MSLSETVARNRSHGQQAPIAETSTPTSAHGSIVGSVRNHLGKTGSNIGALYVAAACVGLVLSVGGPIWALEIGIAVPIAIMAGYCTLICSACVATAPFVLRTLGERTASNAARPDPNYAAWKLVSKFSVSDASRLWCDVEPGCAATQESIAWARALLDAISRGELPMIEKVGIRTEIIERERNNPNWHTEMTRDALRCWATSHGYNPRFLHH
jgi:hypothetical protein